MLLDWVVTFTVYDDSFEVSQIEVDGTDVTSDIEMYYLLSYIYTGKFRRADVRYVPHGAVFCVMGEKSAMYSQIADDTKR